MCSLILGKEGYGGNMGQGGKHARNGDNYHLEIKKYPFYGFTKIIGRRENGWTKAYFYGRQLSKDEGNVTPLHSVEFNNLWRMTNNYKNYARELLPNNIRRTNIKKFIDEIDNNEASRSLYNTLGLIDEFDGLERQYFALENIISLSPFYESLSNRIIEHAEKVTATNEQKKALSYLYTATLSKLNTYKMQNKMGNNTVYNLDEFLTVVNEDIEELKDIDEKIAINKYRNEYKLSLDEKRRSADAFIQNEVIPEIDNIFEKIDEKIDKLISETIKSEEGIQTNIDAEVKRKGELEKTLMLRSLLAPLKIAAPCLSLLGPIGAVAGIGMSGVSTIAETLIDDNNRPAAGGVYIMPQTFTSSFTKLSDQLNDKVTLFKEQINKIDEIIGAYEKDGIVATAAPTKIDVKRIKDNVARGKEFLRNIETMPNAAHRRQWTAKIESIKSDLNDDLTEAITTLEQYKAAQPTESEIKGKIDKSIRYVRYAQQFAGATEMAIDVYRRIRSDNAKIEIANQTISILNQNLKIVKEHKTKVFNEMIPKIEDMKENIDKMYKSLNGMSHAELDIKKWKIQNFFRDMRLYVTQIMTGYTYSMKDDLQLCLTKVDEGMATLIDVYNRIDSYADDAKLAIYIADINSAKSIEIKMNDPELRDAITRLQQIIRSNLVLEKYQLAKHAFKQHYFPFVNKFLNNYDLPQNLRTDNTDSLILHSMNQIKKWQNAIKEKKSISTEYDNVRHSDVYFDGTNQPPFYAWKYRSIKKEINKLFDGNRMVVRSDIAHGVNKNAVKFDEITIRFKLLNERAQYNFNEKFSGFQINMTIIGNSYYRCNKRIYSISLDRNVEIISNHTSINPNDTYRKIKDNDAFLSPYGMWMITLSGDFSKLQDFKNQPMDLELIGHGQYIEHGEYTVGTCTDELNKNYNFDKMISQ